MGSKLKIAHHFTIGHDRQSDQYIKGKIIGKKMNRTIRVSNVDPTSMKTGGKPFRWPQPESFTSIKLDKELTPSS